MDNTKTLYHLKNISDAILPYFRYYAGLYKIQSGSKGDLITIPVKDGSGSLDRYFINQLISNGWYFRYNALLSEIYLIYFKQYPKYIITADNQYIGTFQRLEYGDSALPVYRFPGGDRIADDWELFTGSDDRNELLKRVKEA